VRRVAVVQARTGSTRLPGKVLADLCGTPLLGRVLDRVRRARRLDDVVVATTGAREDDRVVAIAEAAGARWFRGSEHDVLARVATAAREARAEIVVRVAADCPLLDPGIIDQVVAVLEGRPADLDYVTTEPPATYPKGLDVEALYADALARVHRMATSAPAREHVTFFMYGEAPGLFRSFTLSDQEDNSRERWTVDTAADLALVRVLYEDLDLARRDVGYRDVLAHLRRRPSLRAINAHVVQRDPRSEA
jgi:spore coat polysaccharide biosynthesis protein SpsF